MTYKLTYPKHAEALYQALTEDAFYITMEQSVTSGSPQEAMVRYMDYSMIEGELYGELLLPSDGDFGASIWAKPLTQSLESEKNTKKQEFLRLHMGPESLATYNALVAAMAERTAPLINRTSWYLSIVGIRPGKQGNGLGVELIERILKRTDQLRVPTYLETFTPRNISFYERLGYRLLERIHEPVSEADYWVMARAV